MVSSRLRTTIVFFALCGLVAGSAFAGNLSSGLSTNFAHEIATSTTDLSFTNQVYYMGIARNLGQNFILRFTLNNATFGAGAINLVYTPAAGSTGTVVINQRAGGFGVNTVEFDINVTASTIVNDGFTLSGSIRFAAGSAVGATTAITADVRDVISALDTVATNYPAGQTGAYTRTLATLAGAASLTATTQPRATIDATVAVPLTLFVQQGTLTALDDDTTTVAKALVTTADTATGVKNSGGVTDYTLVAADLVTFTINGDFTNIASVGFDLDSPTVPANGITPAAGATTTTAETFTIAANLQSATLQVDGNRLGGSRAIWFTKTAGATLNPRTFTISATVNPTAASGRASQARSIGTSASDWFVWVQNGTTIVAPYVSFTPGNGVKFRFTNSSSNAITILFNVVLDQGTFTYNSNLVNNQFTVPANSSQQITFSDPPTSGTGEIGPIASALLTGTAPVRGKVTFTALTASSNVAGVEIIYSPVGVVTLVNLPQNPSW